VDHASVPWPDVHYGKGATVGSVIAMRQALAPAAVGVDIGCGMSAARTSLTAGDLPDDLGPLRYCSASHGAGRRMSRAAARKAFSVADLAEQTSGVECRKDAGVVDGIPGAYKDLDRVMRERSDLVEVVAHLKQVVCVKG
jgi:RNA-splicing ligase RtcB